MPQWTHLRRRGLGHPTKGTHLVTSPRQQLKRTSSCPRLLRYTQTLQDYYIDNMITIMHNGYLDTGHHNLHKSPLFPFEYMEWSKVEHKSLSQKRFCKPIVTTWEGSSSTGLIKLEALGILHGSKCWPNSYVILLKKTSSPKNKCSKRVFHKWPWMIPLALRDVHL